MTARRVFRGGIRNRWHPIIVLTAILSLGVPPSVRSDSCETEWECQANASGHVCYSDCDPKTGLQTCVTFTGSTFCRKLDENCQLQWTLDGGEKTYWLRDC